ncbi:ABC transporter ATP-binding protein/permease [Paenibacillus doosanensis]|uniref:ABC transporter ATP-binding protein n=1 Tax=Paenibacillus konkukensis TaxID=2020716 RepID=A0ABY4RYS4_9BACL|nr:MULTISPECIES: ABC transporter ATP-binding protein [Paenibacillus]MCS7458676.1 ABC transporter ATP-binding protein/permease [Paenibacillus doosanensis]UQZ86801.1 putative ABC transporter ATP-binding protein [Paenibacillus konkukensis]
MKAKIPAKEYAGLLQSYLRPQKKSIAWLAVLLIAGIVMQLINPQIIRYFIDTAKTQESVKPLLYAAGLFIGVSLLQQVITVIATYIGENVGWIATNKLRGDVAEHCMKLDMSFHKAHTSGAIIERVDGDINNLANFFSNFVVTLLSNMLLVVGMLVLLFREGFVIGLGMTLFVVSAIYAIQYIRKFAVPHWGNLRQMSSKFYGFLGEHLEGTEDTRANGATDYVMHRFFRLIREWLPLRTKAFMGWASMWITTLVVFAIGNAIAFALSAYYWKHGSITLGTVYMIFYYTELMAKPIEKIRTQMEDLQKADASIIRIRELLATQPAIRDGIGLPLPAGPLSVRFNQVDFGYEDDITTLDGIDFRLERGKVLGVLGRTGSGKTTLARLLLRFYDVRSGGISFGDVDIRDAKLSDLRERVGMVTQNIEIFQGTVRDNLTFFREDIADTDIIHVLEELGLKEWFRSLPSGLDSALESGGGGLSAGEAQLISFARVFLSDPGLIILDEASSRLDPATEQKIEQAISRLLVNRTCIIIAHRLATIQRADQILILEQGRVIEFGDRARLASDHKSKYSQMLQVGMEEMLA